MKLFLDTETYSELDLGEVSTYRYAASARTLLISYAVDDGDVQVIDCADRDDRRESDFLEMVMDPGVVKVAHNAMFDRAVLGQRYAGNPTSLRPDAWYCTMVRAYLHGFPGSLGQVGTILGLEEDYAKLADGRRLVMKFCRPAPSNHKVARYDRENSPEDWAKFIEYSRQDIVAMREVWNRLPTWNDDQLGYAFDQEINDRGFKVDLTLARAGQAAAEKEKASLTERFRAITGFAPSQRGQFKNWLHDKGYRVPDTQKQTLEPMLRLPLESGILEAIEIALSANKTSNAKYAAIIPATSADGRLRGSLQFSGAQRTRRWAGRTFQPQNLPSRGLPEQYQIDAYVDALSLGMGELFCGDPMKYGSGALRALVTAPEGKVLYVADLSNIEGRAGAWLAGETWKLKAFAAQDAGTGPDVYKLTAGEILGQKPADVSKVHRNIFGKIPELALGYEGGVGAIQTFAQSFDVRLSDYWANIQESFGDDIIRQARENYESWGRQRMPDLDATEWVASESIKLAWRAKNPNIKSLWGACRDAATQAICQREQVFNAGEHLRFATLSRAGHWYLVCKMPSGGSLVYFDPRINDKGEISYMALDGVTKQWVRKTAYGGLFLENGCQSLSRDLLLENMINMRDKRRVAFVLSVHDEAVAEMPANEKLYTIEMFARDLARSPAWARGMPLSAEGFTCRSYRK